MARRQPGMQNTSTGGYLRLPGKHREGVRVGNRDEVSIRRGHVQMAGKAAEADAAVAQVAHGRGRHELTPLHAEEIHVAQLVVADVWLQVLSTAPQLLATAQKALVEGRKELPHAKEAAACHADLQTRSKRSQSPLLTAKGPFPLCGEMDPKRSAEERRGRTAAELAAETQQIRCFCE
eukprot:scaffold7359_cov255-Pinguiococcus_pyrenoidosus.AAC.7